MEPGIVGTDIWPCREYEEDSQDRVCAYVSREPKNTYDRIPLDQKRVRNANRIG